MTDNDYRKEEDGTWNRSAVMSRGYEIAQCLNDDRSYNDRLSEGMTNAWAEAKTGESEPPEKARSGDGLPTRLLQETGIEGAEEADIVVEASDWKNQEKKQFRENWREGLDFDAMARAGDLTVIVEPEEPIPDGDHVISSYWLHGADLESLWAFAQALMEGAGLDEASQVYEQSRESGYVSMTLKHVSELPSRNDQLSISGARRRTMPRSQEVRRKLPAVPR